MKKRLSIAILSLVFIIGVLLTFSACNTEHTHSYGEPQWKWEEYSAASAVFVCTEDASHTETLKAEISSEVAIAPTCEEEGKTVYTATVVFNGQTYINTKDLITAATHSYGETPLWKWEEYSAASAVFVCTKDASHTETLKAEISSEVAIAPTCEEEGKTVYTATVVFNGQTYITTKDLITAPTHSYGETPLWEWNGYSSANAKFSCGNDASHTVILEATIENTLTTPVSCETNGLRTYTATVTFNEQTYTNTKTESIPKTGHNYSTSPEWSWESYTWVIASFICENDQSHSLNKAAKITNEVTTPAKCNIPGVRTYTAKITFNEQSYTDTKTEIIPAPNSEHEYVNSICTKCGQKEPQYVRVNADGVESTSGNYILFGSYPQSELSDPLLKNTLNGLAGTLPTSGNSQSWTPYDYYISSSNSTDFMWYKDVDYNGEKYRAVYFSSFRPFYTNLTSDNGKSYQDNHGYNLNVVYWFKFEPIKWRILTEGSGKALLLCELAIDMQEYDESNNNYANSNIRKWLNDNFYNTAFDSLQKEIIQLTEVDNSIASTGHSFNANICANTNDNVFILSYSESTSTEYGFTDDIDRVKITTDYGRVQGASLGEASAWLLRSPDYHRNSSVRFVSPEGSPNYTTTVDCISMGGICPALWIAL